MLKKNSIYSSKDLLGKFGGSIQPSMPIVGGKVPYCKFDPKINRNFPAEAWIEIGPMRKKGAELMIGSEIKIPVFEKIAIGQWKYLGEAKVTDVSTSKRLAKINQDPPREKVQKILKLKF